MERIKNYHEAQALVDRYRLITLEEIKREWDLHRNRGIESQPHLTANRLTGFGTTVSCTLCIKVSAEYCAPQCNLCIYNGWHGCTHFEQSKTYNDIDEAASPEQLLDAFRARAEHIKKVVNKKRKKTIIH